MKEPIKKVSPTLQQQLKSADNRTIVIINGHEVLMKDFMADPKKYNNLPFKDISVVEVLSECEKNLKTKQMLLTRPITNEVHKDIDPIF